MKTLHLSLSATNKKIPIHIGNDTLHSLPSIIEKLQSDKIVILHDDQVLHVAKNISNLIPNADLVSVPSGEQSKSLQEVERITNALLEKHVSRDSVLILVGGGMLTDLGAFVASIYMRGIRFISIPTSLLCMVDAAIGGKNGIDVGMAKNILGRFTHPEAILMDTTVLETLPDTKISEGLVEVIKKAAILDAECFTWLENSLDRIVTRDETALLECIEHAVRMKTEVVEADEREGNVRAYLNFGHTVGHALEAASKFQLPHGQAVSRGIVAEMQLANFTEQDRITRLLQAIAMPLDGFSKDNVDTLWEIMENDKKTRNKNVIIAVPKTIGEGHMLQIHKDDLLRIAS